MQTVNLDCVVALAVVHHLCISQNCSFSMLASLWSELASELIVEFVDARDSWATVLLEQKGASKDLFLWYNRNEFECAFTKYYEIRENLELSSGNRVLYRMQRR